MADTDENKKPAKPDRLGDLDRRVGALEQAKPPSMDQIMAMFAAQAEQIEALRGQVSSLVVTRPRELAATEAEQIMNDKPTTRFLVIAGGPTAMKPGDHFDARSKFQTARHLAQTVSSGLRIAVAG